MENNKHTPLTLQQCKDEIARKNGFKDYSETYVTQRKDWSIGEINDEAAELYASQFTRELSELREELQSWKSEHNQIVLDYGDRLKELREENERLKEGLKAMLNEFTPANYDLFCDHSVGLCACKPLDIIDNATKLLQSKP